MRWWSWFPPPHPPQLNASWTRLEAPKHQQTRVDARNRSRVYLLLIMCDHIRVRSARSGEEYKRPRRVSPRAFCGRGCRAGGGSRSYCWPPEPPRRLPFKIPNHFFLFFEKQQEPKSAKTLLSARLPTLARGSRWTIKTQLQKKKTTIDSHLFSVEVCPHRTQFSFRKKKSHLGFSTMFAALLAAAL